MSTNGNETRRSGRPAKLSREAVVDAAQAVVDREGVDGLTMRAVGAEIGAPAMSLYRHVSSKDELLVLLLDRAARQVRRPELPRDPRQRLTVLCRLLHDELALRPWAVRVLASGKLIGPSVLWLIEEVTAGFRECGLDASSAYRAYRVVWRYIVGELTVPVSGTAAGAERTQSAAVLDDLDPARFPSLAEARRGLDGSAPEATFEPGLAALLDGLTGGN